MVDDEEESLCGALAEMRAIYEQRGEQKSERKLALGLIKKKMEERGLTAREAAEELGVERQIRMMG